ncbi:hypothetical protein A2U01_0077271, partial [Trifolium medium]|nr:hypothetical protein [Trifolium medium]
MNSTKNQARSSNQHRLKSSAKKDNSIPTPQSKRSSSNAVTVGKPPISTIMLLV